MAHTETQTEWEETMARRVMNRSAVSSTWTSAISTRPWAPCPLPRYAAPRRPWPPTAPTCITRRNGYCSSTAKTAATLPRAYLHSLFHCILRHLWLRDRRDPALWGLCLRHYGGASAGFPGHPRHHPSGGLAAAADLRPAEGGMQAAGRRAGLPGAGCPPTPPPCRNTARNSSVTTTGCGPPTLTVPPPGCGASSGSRWADRPS